MFFFMVVSDDQSCVCVFLTSQLERACCTIARVMGPHIFRIKGPLKL